MKSTQLSGILDDARPTKDGGMKIVFLTQEMTPEEKAEIMTMYQNYGWVVFKPTMIQDDEVPDLPPKDREVKKTTSERLRAILFVYFTQVLAGDPKKFNQFYENWKEKKIEEVKKVLDEKI